MGEGVEPPAIRVVGSGTVVVAPDRARIVFGVEKDGRDLPRVQAAADEAMAAVIARLRELGVAERDLWTTGYTVGQRYNPQLGRPDGHTVANRLQVVVRDLDAVGALVSAGVAAGADGIQQLTFYREDRSEAVRAARGAAARDARDRADQYAAALGVRVGLPSRIAEIGGGDEAPPPQFRAMRARAPLEAESAPIEAGEQTITVTVEVHFGIERAD